MLFFVVANPGFARETGHTVYGTVTDNITGNGIAAKVTLMTVDSVVIASQTARIDTNIYTSRTFGSYSFEPGVSKVGKYIIKAEAPGYETAYVNFKLVSNREQKIGLQTIQMARAWQNLPEVTVKATKVKMVMHGDTIVYNADAFNLAEGSMLDALIKELPGTKLTKDGQIYVNGRFVESLLVNGHDFFNGNAQVALQNLPAYTVNKIKVYDKAGQASEMMGRDMGDKQYVMDVRLKKEYAHGYMGNIDAGGSLPVLGRQGLGDRYRLHGFGLNFTETSRLMAFANMNNLNENEIPDLNGEWNPQDMPDGLLATKSAGIGYTKFFGGNFGDKWFSASTIYTHTNADDETRESRQTFLPGGDTFNNAVSKMTNSSDREEGNLSLSWTVPGFYTFDWLKLSYQHTKGWGNSNTITSDSASVLNHMITESSSDIKDFNASLKSEHAFRVFAVDMIRFGIDAKYNRLKQKSFSLNDMQYTDDVLARDYRDNYLDAPHQDFNISTSASYDILFKDFNIKPGYTYSYTYNKTHNMLYRLDKIASRDSSRIDLLPSAREALNAVLDGNNSYYFREYRNEHTFNIYYNRGNWRLLHAEVLVNLPLRYVNSNLHYYRLGMHGVSKHSLFFEPNIRLNHWCNKANWNLTAEMKSDFPDLTTMIDYRDDSDPLYIRLGNPELKNIHRYNVDGSLSFKGEHQRVLRFSAGWHKTDNAVAYGLSFDKNTGISTMQPMSVNGNWDVNGAIGLTRAFGKDDKFTTDNELTFGYNHNVDLATSFESHETPNSYLLTPNFPERSIVNNYRMGGNLKFNYRPNSNYTFTIHGGGTYNIIRSHRNGFENINAGDYNIGFNTVLNLPWKLQLSTDMTMFARRGWQQNEMNTTDWVWNAQLSRIFFKGKLVTKVQGFDLLHELSTTQYMVNEQGRTETWRNSIPRYAMLTISWRFNHNPKNIQTSFY